jgi:cytochrome c'
MTHQVTNKEHRHMAIQINKIAKLLSMAGAVALVSCSPSAEPVSRPVASSPIVASQRPASGQIGAHWIQDQHLRLVMAQLSSRNPSWPAGIPQEPESPGQGQPAQFDEVALLAAALGNAADQLPEVAGRIKMTEADRRGFLAEAQTLRDQASGLQHAAEQRRIEQMQTQMELINSTCISCHSRYRDFSGQLNAPRASASSADGLALWISAGSNNSSVNH